MTKYATGTKTLRIDTLPENVRNQILALAAKASQNGSTITAKQVEYVLDALQNGLRKDTNVKSAKGWEKTNAAIAVGRVALVFLNENPAIKTQFKNHISKMQSSGRVTGSRMTSKSPESATG